MTEAQTALVREKVATLRRELTDLGLDSSFFYRSPGSAKGPVGFLLIGETQEDLEAARNA